MTCNEEKAINNFRLFIALLKNKELADIEELLSIGADVNATDNNDNTPIHVSIRKCRKDITQLFLDKNACVLNRNKDGHRPIDIAKRLDSQDGKEIVKMLEVVTKKQEALVNSNQSTTTAQSGSGNKKKEKIPVFIKRPGTSGVSGQLYETKLLSLVFLRARSDIEIGDFYLATNIKGIGALDDLCCKYTIKGEDKSVRLFLQAKHRDDPTKGRFTANDLRSVVGDFYLPKYFDSYLSIISKFDPDVKDPMFRDELKNVELNFVIYTPAKEDFLKNEKLLAKNVQSKKIHKLISTSEKESIFQFNYDANDIEYLTTAKREERIKQLGHNFLELIMSEKNKLQVIMTDELIRKYHVVLAQKVVLISPNIVSKEYRIGKFRPEFLKTYDRNLSVLRNILFKDIVENHSKKTSLSKEEIVNYLQLLQEVTDSTALSKLLGCLIMYDEKNNKLNLIENNLLESYFNEEKIQIMKHEIRNVQVNAMIINEAIHIAGISKLELLEFKLPIAFGNLDLTIKENKVDNRLDRIAKALKDLFISNRDSKIIEINKTTLDQSTSKNDEQLQPGMLDTNGGIGGAVGTLLIPDENSKMLRFNTNTYLPPNAKLFLEKLKKIVPEGENLADYKVNINLNYFPRTSFHETEDDIQAEIFLNRLWFYTNEAKEDEVEGILKKEIDKYYNAYRGEDHFVFRIHSDAIYLKFHDVIQKWWMRSSNAPYLTHQSAELDLAKKDVIDCPLVTVLNVMCDSAIKKIGIKFNDDSVKALNLNKYTNRIVNVITEANILSGIKIKQYYNNSNNYAFINFDYVLSLPINDYNSMLCELYDTKLEILIIMYELPKTMKGLSDKLQLIIKKFKGTKIVIVTNDVLGNEIKLHYPENYRSVIDNTNKLVNFTSETEENFLKDTKIIFQGETVSLSTIIDENAKSLLNAKVLRKLINNEKIHLGHTVTNQKYEDIKEYYADRHIKRGEKKYRVEALEDIDHQVVVIFAKPDMGKSTLLTHLAIKAKNDCPAQWIVRLDFVDYTDTFCEWQTNGTNVDKQQCLKLLCIAALKNVDSKTKFELNVVNGEITLGNYEGLASSTILEIELFLYFYNNNKVTLLFYGFDYVCPPYGKEVIKMLKIIEDDDIRMWICCNSTVTCKNALESAFGTVYTLEPVNEIGQKSFFHKFWKTNLKLETLNYEQFSNISDFLQYMAGIDEFDEHARQMIPWISMPLHLVYIVAVEFFQSELCNVSSVTVTETVKKHLNFDLAKVTTLGKYLEKTPEAEQAQELAGTPLHMYVAANYFECKVKERLKIEVDGNELKKKWDIFINTVSLYQRFLYNNLNNIFYNGNHNLDEDAEDEKRKNFIEKHKKLALYAICKEEHLRKLLSEEEINEIKNMMTMYQTDPGTSPMFNCVLDDAPKFFHLLFAEYSAVEYLIELLNATRHGCAGNILKHKALWDFIVNVFLMTCSKSVRNAFDYKIKNDPDMAEMTSSESCQKIVFELLLKQNNNSDPITNSKDVLNVALNEGMVNFVNVLLKCVEVNLDHHNVGTFVEIVKRSAFLLSAFDTRYGNIAKKILDLINNIDREKVRQVLSSNEVIDIPVRIASICGNSQVVEDVRENIATVRNTLLDNSDNLFGLSVDTINLVQDVCNIFLQHRRRNS